MSKEKKIIVGAHTSISGGLYKAVERAENIGGTTMQIFTKSSRKWFEKKLTKEEIQQFKEAVKKSSLSHIIAHTAYLINLASSNPDVEKKSITALKQELERCKQLDIHYLVLHPGSHTGSGENVGIKKIAKNLDNVLENINGTTKILLETMAGQGTNLGYTFEQLKSILKLCKHKKHIGICLDTCHVFSAGYDISTPKNYELMMEKFNEIIGLSLLKAIHINDSKTECGSRKDRHESLGKGTIPLLVFKSIMQDKRLENIPKILETPISDKYKDEIKMLKKWALSAIS